MKLLPPSPVEERDQRDKGKAEEKKREVCSDFFFCWIKWCHVSIFCVGVQSVYKIEWSIYHHSIWSPKHYRFITKVILTIATIWWICTLHIKKGFNCRSVWFHLTWKVMALFFSHLLVHSTCSLHNWKWKKIETVPCGVDPNLGPSSCSIRGQWLLCDLKHMGPCFPVIHIRIYDGK